MRCSCQHTPVTCNGPYLLRPRPKVLFGVSLPFGAAPSPYITSRIGVSSFLTELVLAAADGPGRLPP